MSAVQPKLKVSPSIGPKSTAAVIELIRDVGRKGVKFRLQDGDLRCVAPKGVLTRTEVETLREWRDDVISILRRATERERFAANPGPRTADDRVPLTLLQILLHWQYIGSCERPSQRATASAMRIRGILNVDSLRKCVQRLILRHEALRTRVVIVDGQPTQQIVELTNSDLRFCDLSGVPGHLRETEIQQHIANCIREPVNLETDPLFAFLLLKLQEDEYVLLIAMEHIVSDGSSLGILWRDLLMMYSQAVHNTPAALPQIPVQFADYAVWQARAHSLWMKKHGAEWIARMQGCAPAKFPVDEALPEHPPRGWATVSIDIEAPLVADWKRWCRMNATTPAMSAFTTYVALLLRWCAATEAVVGYQTNGRFSPKIDNTVGLFASVIYLRVQTLEEHTLTDLLRLVTEQHSSCYTPADYCYLAAQIPRPEFSRTTAFNWIPHQRTSSLADTGDTTSSISVEPLSFVNPVLEEFDVAADPSISFVESEHGVTGALHFPLKHFTAGTMERFARNFAPFLRTLLSKPATRIKDVQLA
jgi:condensation domain-containing protein/tubulysin polyketide synthase-like protein